MTTAVPPSRSAAGTARAAALRAVIMLNEVEAGVRPARQICPLFAVHLRGAIQRARPAPGPVAEVRRLLVTPTGEDVVQVVAICRRHVGEGGRQAAGGWGSVGEGGRQAAGGWGSVRFTGIGLQLTRRGPAWHVTDMAHPRFPVARHLAHVRPAE